MDKELLAKAFGGTFLEYAIAKLETYGFHFTSHQEWEEIKRLAMLGEKLEKIDLCLGCANAYKDGKLYGPGWSECKEHGSV